MKGNTVLGGADVGRLSFHDSGQKRQGNGQFLQFSEIV